MSNEINYQAIVEALKHGVLIVEVGAEPKIIYTNPACANLGDPGETDLFKRYPGEAFKAAFQNLATGRKPGNVSVVVQSPETKSVWFELNLHPLPKQSAQDWDYFLIEEQDITEQIDLENMRMNLMQVDPGTGVYNQRSFFAYLAREWQRDRRYSSPLTLVVLDIDNFKRINTEHGSDVGDLVLQVVARECQLSLRTHDVVGRTGSNEFAIFMPETNLDGGLLVADRIREAIEAMSISSKAWSVRTTISAGVAEVKSTDETSDAVYLRATEALQSAKQKGGNRSIKQS